MNAKNLEESSHPLRTHIEVAVWQHLKTLDNTQANNIYDVFLAELEKPLFLAMLEYTRGNQSKTAQLLGLNRGTLRTKLKHYGLL